MADNVNEESDYTPGKDELDWGYEEGRLDFISMSHSGPWFCFRAVLKADVITELPA